MNASRLREIIDLLIDQENSAGVQDALSRLNDRLGELAGSPGDTNQQKQFSDALDKYRNASAQVRNSFEPSQIPLIEELGARPYFLDDLAAAVSKAIVENPIAPTVVHQLVRTALKSRSAYLEKIRALAENLKAVNIEANPIKPGEAEIGFLLPRALFNNRLDQLIKELRDVNRIIRAFSEVATGAAEEVEVRQISASDPLFFFALAAPTIAALAKAVSWALATWKSVEEIRKVRADILHTKVLTEKEIEELFERKIQDKLQSAVGQKVAELVPPDDKPGRAKEQRTDLTWALESLLAHIERGVVIEIRSLPPTTKAEGSLEPIDTSFATLKEIASQLTFPNPQGTPIMKLPPPPVVDPRNE